MLIITFVNDGAYPWNGPKGDYEVQVHRDHTLLWEGKVEGHWRYKGWEDLVKALLDQKAKERWKYEPVTP